MNKAKILYHHNESKCTISNGVSPIGRDLNYLNK